MLLLRSMLFVTAHNKKFMEKAVKTNADALVLDMEDAVPEDCKEIARQMINESLNDGLFNDKQVFVRLNSIDSPHFIKDVDASMHKDVIGFMPPKIQCHEDIVFLDKLLTQKENEFGLPQGHFKLAPLIETTAAVMNLMEIISYTNRLVALCFGGADFLNNLSGSKGNDKLAFNTPRSMIAMAARSINIAPIDTPYFDLPNMDGFYKDKKECYDLGFAGTLLINPRQIDPAHDCFTPSEEEVKHAESIINARDIAIKKGEGCVMLGQEMIGPPMQERAEQTLKFMDLIHKK